MIEFMILLLDSMHYKCVYRSNNCVFHDKVLFFCAAQFSIVSKKVAMLWYINSVFSQSCRNYHETGQLRSCNGLKLLALITSKCFEVKAFSVG